MEVKVVDVNEGDLLIIRTPIRLPYAQAQAIRLSFQKAMPLLMVAVLESGMEIDVIRLNKALKDISFVPTKTAPQDDPAARDTQEAARKTAGDETAVYDKRQDKAIELDASGAERRARQHIEPSPLSCSPGSIAAELPIVSGETPRPKPRLRYG